MSKITYTEEFTQDEIMEFFREHYVEFDEIESVTNMMENPEIEMNWDSDGGIYISITEKGETDEID